MNLIQNYALQLGQKINKFDVFEKFIPKPTENPYLCIHTTSKPSKSYSRWQDSIDILKPILSKNKIDILQIGDKNDTRINGVYDMCGGTSFGQTAYLIRDCLLFLGCDSFPGHLSGHYSKSSIILVSNNYKSCVECYFGDKSRQIFLEPDRTKFPRPSFSFDENPKSIDTIKPEIIAESVLKLLGIEEKIPYKFLFFGENYTNRILELVPNSVVDSNKLGVETLVIRNDLFQNEQMIAQQLNICNAIIITKDYINIDLIRHFKNKIKQIIFIIDEQSDPKTIFSYQNLGIKVDMFSYLSEERLNEIKLKFCEIGIIFNRAPKSIFEIPELKEKSLDNLYYKSNRFILSSGKIYLSEYDLSKNNSTPSFDEKISKVTEDSEILQKEINHIAFLEKE